VEWDKLAIIKLQKGLLGNNRNYGIYSISP